MPFSRKYLLCALFQLLFSAYSFSLPVIFDLGGVLLETNKIAASQAIWYETLGYFWHSLGYAGHPQKFLLETLHKVKPLTNPELSVQDGKGQEIPQLMRDWLAGTIDSEEILTTIRTACQNNPQLVRNKAEQALLMAMTTMIFTPANFALTQELIPEGLIFAQRCKEQGHTLYALTNWDSASLDIVMARYPELFDLFDGIIVSGEVGYIKPQPEIYRILLDTFALNPATCIFIDDQPANLRAAECYGISTIHCSKHRPLLTPWSHYADFTAVQKRFDALVSLLEAQA